MESINKQLNASFSSMVFVRCWLLVDLPQGLLFKRLCDSIDQLGLGRQLEEVMGNE